MVLNDVILQAGGEGGSVALYGLRSGSDWMFSLDFISPVSGHDKTLPEDIAVTWEGALALLDRYPWHRLVPVQLHPDFRDQIMDAMVRRYESDEGGSPPALQRWQEADINPRQVAERVHAPDTWLYDLVDDD
jgi:hypothetical protein